MSTPTPTSWVQNPDKIAPAIGYSDSSVTYSSSTTRYSGIDVTEPEFNETPTSWAGAAKDTTSWQANTEFDDAQYPYDSASHTYDSAIDTYDGVTSGESSITTTAPTAWS